MSEPERFSFPHTRDVPVDVHLPRGEGDGSVLVALHGQGMTAGTFGRHVLPLLPDRMAAVLPQGPLPFEIRKEGAFRQGCAWYIYLGDDELFVASMQRTETWLLGVIDHAVAEYGFDADNVSLLGFSQGGYFGGYFALRNAARLRRAVIAGARIKHEVLEEAVRAAPHPFNVLAVHGDQDESVRAAAARASADQITAWGVPVDFRTYAAPHAVLRDDDCRRDVRAFLGGTARS